MEIKKHKTKEALKIIRSISADEKTYNEFKEAMKKRGYSISEIIDFFMRKVLEITKEGGGKIVINIEKDTKKKEVKNNGN